MQDHQVDDRTRIAEKGSVRKVTMVLALEVRHDRYRRNIGVA